MARKGGNPELVKFQFQQKSDEPFDKKVGCRVTQRQKEKLDKIKNWPEIFRQWVDSLPDE